MVSAAWAVLLLGQVVSGLRTTPGSPCESSCSPSNDTLPSEIVCADAEYTSTEAGRNFKECISCQLQSTFEDDATRQSDVEWALYNLRYAFSSCVYGYPEKVSNISNSCPVACEELTPSLEFQLEDPSGENLETWCETASFADNEISECGQCYNLTSNEPSSQVYIANFLESLRYNCHFETPTEEKFPITPSRIFSESLLPSSTADLISGGSGTNNNLALIIAMPILGFVILLCILALGCFFFIRSRRKKARRLRQPGHLHARWNDTGISTPQWAMEHPYPNQDPYQNPYHSPYPAQAQGMYHPTPPQNTMFSPQAMYASPPQEFAQAPGPGPGYGSGFGFVDSDGKVHEHEIGYSKVVEPVIASPSTAYSPEEKGPQAHAQQMYFPPPPGNGKGREM